VETNPLPIEKILCDVDAAGQLTIQLAPGGGTAIRFREVN